MTEAKDNRAFSPYKAVLGALLSLKTTVVLLLVFILLFLWGSIVMPGAEVYESINGEPLLKWMSSRPLSATWWLWAAFIVLALTTVNTLCCSVESIIKRRQSAGFLLMVSPQVIHLGFLLIMLAHLLSSIESYHGYAALPEGGGAKIPGGLVLKVSRIDIRTDEQGYLTHYGALIEYLRDGQVERQKAISPNNPSFYAGYGVYIKKIEPYFTPDGRRLASALLEISQDKGAPWAFSGAVLFTLGTISLIVFRIKQER